MNTDIQIIEKPEWVTWDDIHGVLVQAHAENRANGINMRKPSLPGDEIKKEIGDDGVMLVALDGKRVVGTAALLVKTHRTWYNRGKYGYMCFAAILPEYNGRGIYAQLCKTRENIAIERGLTGLYIDTHHRNIHVINIALRNGFRKVDIKICKDHWNVVLFKLLRGNSYSRLRCHYKFCQQKYWKIFKKDVKAILRI